MIRAIKKKKDLKRSICQTSASSNCLIISPPQLKQKPPNNKRKLEYSNVLQDIEKKLTELEIARAKKEINKITQRDL